MLYKFDHAHIGETATDYRSKGYAALDDVDEQSIKMWEYNQRVFTAVVREIYLANNKKAAIPTANAFATAVVKRIGAAKLVAFMNEYVSNSTFRAVVNDCVAAADEDKTVAAIEGYVGDEKAVEFFNEDALVAYDGATKKAQLGVILDTLMAVLIKIAKLKISSVSKTVLTHRVKTVMADLKLAKKGSYYFQTTEDGEIIPETAADNNFKAQTIIVAIASLSFVNKDFYDEVVEQINGVAAGTAAQKFAAAYAIYNDLTVTNGKVGVQALVQPAYAVSFA